MLQVNLVKKSLAALAAACLTIAAHSAQTSPTPAAVATPATAASAPTDKTCLSCHDGSQTLKSLPADGKKAHNLRPLKPAALAAGAHAKLQCADCHQDVTDTSVPHKPTGATAPNCLACHQKLWEQAKKEGKADSSPGLALVMHQWEGYKESVHSRPNPDEPGKPNATCSNCHDTHTFAIRPPGSPERAAWRLTIPQTCGTCHDDHLDEYSESVHGKAVLDKGDPKAAICADCHNPHGVDQTNKAEAKLHAVKACATCHKDNARSYADTYHGQIENLGYSFTAMCFNCHGSHDILPPSDPNSHVSAKNRLKTCQKCHKEATAKFASFQPHGNAHDFKKYPQIWLTTKFMVGLLAGTFAFFWIHVILWLYRSLRERAQGKMPQHVRVDQLGIPPGKQVRRFGPWWRLGHLLFAVSLMILTLTGMTLMYSGSSWAPVVIRLLGGPKTAGLIHRVNALIFTAVFLIHLVYIVMTIGRRWRTFKWFGSDSLIPNLQDGKDAIAMFKWFFGRGPRPIFDRWTYWEKFDYWAPFWGVAIVGITGFMMWFPNLTSAFLPGWVFNVAAITHGEEAFLAAVFLFTVHFFNNHFRPEKFPLDVVMFTGSMPLEHFARDHTVQYRRLVESGELQKYLVDAPSKPMKLGSRILGFTLIAFGLTLLVLIVTGFTHGLMT